MDIRVKVSKKTVVLRRWGNNVIIWLYQLSSQLQKREEAGNELLCAEHSGIAWVDKFAKT